MINILIRRNSILREAYSELYNHSQDYNDLANNDYEDEKAHPYSEQEVRPDYEKNEFGVQELLNVKNPVYYDIDIDDSGMS